MQRLVCVLAFATAGCGVPDEVVRYTRFLERAGVKVHPSVAFDVGGRLAAVAKEDMAKGDLVCEVRSDQMIQVRELDEKVVKEWAKKVHDRLDGAGEGSLLTEDEVDLALKLLLDGIDVASMSPMAEAQTKCWPDDIRSQRAALHGAAAAFGNACKHLGLVSTSREAQATLLHVMLHATRMPGASRRSIVPLLHAAPPSATGSIAPYQFTTAKEPSALFTATFALTRPVAAGTVLTSAVPPGRPLSSVVALTGEFPDASAVTHVVLPTTWGALSEDTARALRDDGCFAPDGATGETRGITLTESGEVEEESLRCVTVAAAGQVAAAVAAGTGVKAGSVFGEGWRGVGGFDFSDVEQLPGEVRLAGNDLFLDVVAVHEDKLPDDGCTEGGPALLQYNAKQRAILHHASERLSRLAETILVAQQRNELPAEEF
eukprot:gene20299-31247_t